MAETTVTAGPEPAAAHALRRGMGLRNVVSTSAGLAFAAIEYPAIAGLLGFADPSLVWVAVLAAAVFALIAWGFFAELNGMYPSAAAMRVYLKRGLNDKVSLTITFAYLSTVTLVIGADAYIVGNAITFVLHQPAWMAFVYIVALLALAVVANLRGVKIAAGLQDIAVYAVIGVTLVIAALALSHSPTEAASAYQALHAPQRNIGSYVSAIIVGIFLYSAFEWVVTNSEEVTQARHVPIGMLIALGMLTLTIIMVGTAMGRLLSGAEIESPYPQLYLGQAAAGAVGFGVMLGVTGATAINTFNGGFITASRFMYALAREGSLPKPLARLNGRLVPYVPVLLLAGMALLIAVVVQVTRAVFVLIEVGAVFEALIYMMAGLSVLMLRRREPLRERPFRFPGLQVIGWIGAGAFGFLALFASLTVGPDLNAWPFVIGLVAIYGSWWYVTRILPRLRRQSQAAPRRRPGARRTAAASEAADVAVVNAAAAAIRPRLRQPAPTSSAPALTFGRSSMYSRTDRLLALLFIVQLVAAIALGAILVSGLRNGNQASQTVITQGGVPSAEPSASGSAGSAGTAGGGGGSRTTTTGGGGGPALNTPIAAGAPIKVGAIVTQTGAINFTGSAQGTKAYLDMINSQGGVNGHKIELTLLDDQLDPTRGNSEVQQLINDQVFAFVGFNAPLTENQLVPTVERAQMPVIGAYGEYAEYLTPWVFAFTADYPHYGYQMGRYLGGLGIKTPALVYITNSNDNADNSFVNGVAAGLQSKGIALDKSKNVFKKQPTDASYDDAVVQMQLNSVDGMVTFLDQTAYVRLQQSLNRASYHPTHVGNPELDDPLVINDASVGQSVNGAYVASDFTFIDSHSPAINAYVDAVRAEFGGQAQINDLGLIGWMDARAFVDAVRSLGGSITRQGLLDAINGKKVNGEGITAPWNYEVRNNGHDLVRCLQLGKIVGGKVEPAEGFNCDNENTKL